MLKGAKFLVGKVVTLSPLYYIFVSQAERAKYEVKDIFVSQAGRAHARQNFDYSRCKAAGSNCSYAAQSASALRRRRPTTTYYLQLLTTNS